MRGSSSSSGGGGGGGGCELTLDEASTVCKCALSLLGPTGGTAKGETSGDPAGEGLVKKEGEATTPDMFPLDIDQEVLQKLEQQVNTRDVHTFCRCFLDE